MFQKFSFRKKSNAGQDEPSPSPGSFRNSHHNSVTSTASWRSRAAVNRRDVSSTSASGNESSFGLTVIYTPDTAHKVDIVFVHGLGGTSRGTWTKHKDAELFWPLKFLPLEPDLCLARIMTFGYNSKFKKSRNATTSVLDFAKDLLFDLKYAKNDETQELEVGKVPLIFVVHSMGGLIVKEAYMQGQNDPAYEDIIKAVSAIIFLATPHRGTNLAQALNRMLDSMMTTTPKQYIADLAKNSLTLQKLNEQFRHIAPRLDIVSFYETQPTQLAKGARVMVLEKDSSVLGYPGEISKALDSDHNEICKYEGRHDPNYIAVRNVLKSLVSKIITESNAKAKANVFLDQSAPLDVRALLAITEPIELDYMFFRDQWTEGTSAWILEDSSYEQWRDRKTTSHPILWINGRAGSGKSIIASYLVNSLVEEGVFCQYFFIRFGDQKKRCLSFLLRSLAYQISQSAPGFLRKVIELANEAIDFETADPKVIWDRIFKSILFEEKLDPIYWVIDGLDEAKDPSSIVKLLCDISSSIVPIKILFTSRQTPELITAFERIPQADRLNTITIAGHLEDIRRHIRQQLTVPEVYREGIEQRIVEGSQNNFLWVRLAVSGVNQCHTGQAITAALQELPVGMEAFYDRMGASIVQIPSPGDKRMAGRILQCIACSLRGLALIELSEALGDIVTDMLDLRRTIAILCGDFVVMDGGGNVGMIHQTARDYLLREPSSPGQYSIDKTTAHKQMFMSCMACLMSPGLRAKLGCNRPPGFLGYAASSWCSHLISAPANDVEVITTLRKFLMGNWVLTWIHALALRKQLKTLVQSSRNLSKFAANVKKQMLETEDESRFVVAQELFESWAVDLLRIVGKFNNVLHRRPDSIYKSVPPFCPKASSIYQIFGKAEARNLSVSGLSADKWDDLLAQFTLGQGSGVLATSIATAGSTVAALTSSGNVSLYDSFDFTETAASPITHQERVDRMVLNSTATLLVTYGYHTTKLWDVSTGKCKTSVPSIETKTRPLVMQISNNSSTLLVGSDDRRIRSLDLTAINPAWQVVAAIEEEEIEGYFKNAASHMALSKDGDMVAVAYRNHPASAWEIDGSATLIGHCWRKVETVAIRELRALFWLPHQPEIIGLNIEGVIFKWEPYTGEIDELPAAATKLSLSRDGNLIVTGHQHGRLKIYTTSTLTLIYQMAAQDAVFDLNFSPDSRRFYDDRGYYANVWEPEVLLKHEEQFLDSENENSGIPSDSGSVKTRAVDSIKTVAGSPKGRLYCTGTERGVVDLYDIQRGKIGNLHVSRAKFTIEHIVWSSDGKYVAFTDMSKQITVKSVTEGAGGGDLTIEDKIVTPLGRIATGHIIQLSFSADSSHLLVHTSTKLFVLSLDSPGIQSSWDLPSPQTQWMVHPSNAALLLGFGSDFVLVLNWTLTQCAKYDLKWPESVHDHQPKDFHVQQALGAPLEGLVLLRMSHPSDRLAGRLLYLQLSAIDTSPQEEGQQIDSESRVISLKGLEEGLSADVALLFACLSRGRFLYLSKSFAVCSGQLLASPRRLGSRPVNNPIQPGKAVTAGGLRDAHKTVADELFALPGDWVSRDSLSACSLWPVESSLLYPRNGECAVVKNRGLSK